MKEWRALGYDFRTLPVELRGVISRLSSSY
jgi:hypothetical protein